MLYPSDGAVLNGIADGRVNLLCEKRKVRLPAEPTLNEERIDFSNTWLEVVAKPGTPTMIVQRPPDALCYASESKDIVEHFARNGSDTAAETAEPFNALMNSDMAVSMPVILLPNIRNQ